ncbi:MAG: tetraacyldisaccharide 4'-kinase [Rhodocyclaceae bacterium]|nr:tetraacyldisaccharide 4'-kinase [Rhodocyclaceae bacterium]MBX3666949.1 tetraacyldisaccharide 4'-kinase [Rhodocyclaceae bacterium]
MGARAYLARAWLSRGPAAWPLLPLAALFATLSGLRRAAYRFGWLRSERLPRPVVVIGNVNAGGSGKTPLTLRLAQDLAALGRRPGIVSRGYGGSADTACEVTPDADPAVVGDEPALMRARAACPVWIGRDRAAAGRGLIAAHPEVDVILTDDGLQHYRLARNLEIAVVDPLLLGNRWPLPAGPLREPLARLRRADMLVVHGEAPDLRHLRRHTMRLEAGAFYRLGNAQQRCTAADLAGRELHAVAGIGRPRRFFDSLRALGLRFTEHEFADHHHYQAADFPFAGAAIVLLTEKDAVKCARLALRGEFWVLPVDAEVQPDLARSVLALLEDRTDGCTSA